MRFRTASTSLALATALVAMTACSSDSSSSTSKTPDASTTTVVEASGALAWDTCDVDELDLDDMLAASAEQMGLECATLAVPVDHDDPDGETIDLALGRIGSARSAQRIGSIVVNPGGPGGSGLEFLAMAAMVLPPELTKRFDIVSFDPRGLGASSGLECFDSDERATWIDDQSDVDETDQAAVSAINDAFETALVEGCQEDDPVLLANIGTDSVVDDLELIREALGDEKLSFWGMSYGTRIGAAYATRYPDRVRAIVLDSPISPDLKVSTLSSGQVVGITRSLDGFIAWCNATPDCAAGPDTAATIKSIATKLSESPIEGDPEAGTESLDDTAFSVAVITALYDASYSMPLAEALAILNGPPSDRTPMAAKFLADLAGMQNSKRDDGTYGNGFEIQRLVNCAVSPGPMTLEEAQAIPDTVSPYFFDERAAAAGSCLHIPTGDAPEIGQTAAADSILIIGTVGDPATPYEWMGQLADALGVTKRLTNEGWGHAVSVANACVAPQMVEFFITPEGFTPTDCADDPAARDIFAVLTAQIAAMGLPEHMAGCISDGLRATMDPLELASMNADDDAMALTADISRIALSCR